jgi:hypothetical protein
MPDLPARQDRLDTRDGAPYGKGLLARCGVSCSPVRFRRLRISGAERSIGEAFNDGSELATGEAVFWQVGGEGHGSEKGDGFHFCDRMASSGQSLTGRGFGRRDSQRIACAAGNGRAGLQFPGLKSRCTLKRAPR